MAAAANNDAPVDNDAPVADAAANNARMLSADHAPSPPQPAAADVRYRRCHLALAPQITGRQRASWPPATEFE